MRRKFKAILLNIGSPLYGESSAPPLASGCLMSWALADPDVRSSSSVSFLPAGANEGARSLAARVARLRPALVGFTCYVWNIRESLEAASRLKELLPESLIVFGGPEAAGCGRELLVSQPAIDMIAGGEGEETFRLLLKNLAAGGSFGGVPGLLYRERSGVVSTPDPELIDLSKLPSPFLLGHIEVPHNPKVLYLESSRGCPFTCSFCEWGPRQMRHVPLERLREEVAFAVAAGAKNIKYVDADILMDRKRALPLLQTFLDLSADSPAVLHIETNPVHLWPEIVDLISEQPKKFYLSFGLQSISPEVMRKINRPFNFAKIEERLGYLNERCPQVRCNYSVIFGLPGETLEGFCMSLEWALRRHPTRLHSHHCLILPGSDLLRQASSLKIEFQKTAPHQVLETPSMPRSDMEAARELAFWIYIVSEFPLIRDYLFTVAKELPEERWRYLGVIRRWARFVESRGMDLGCGCPIGAIGRFTPCDLAYRAKTKLLADPLALASLDRITKSFVETESPGRLERTRKILSTLEKRWECLIVGE